MTATTERTAPARRDDGFDPLDTLRRHSDHSSAFLTLNAETEHYRPAEADGFVAYRPRGRRHVYQFGPPVAAAGDRVAVIRSFLNWAGTNGHRVTAVQLDRPTAETYADHGFSADQLGASYSIDLDGYGLRGRKFVKTRNMISRARREGVTVAELDPATRSEPGVAAELKAVDASWLKAKGWHVKEIDFMIGERGGRGDAERRLFVARHRDRIVGYVSYSPVYGSRGGWLYDLTRRRPDAPPGVIECVFAEALSTFQAEGHGWLHLGFTPFTQISPEHEIADATSAPVAAFVRTVGARGASLYPAKAQESFKLKWHPQVIEPEYLAFAGRPSFSALWGLLRVTRTI